MLRSLLVVCALVGVASAQPSTVQPAAAPPPASASVMDNRWALGLDLGWETLKIKGGDKVTFGTLEIAVRFRIRPAIEVALSGWGGGTAGDISLGGLYASFRYRFLAEQKWNVYGVGALGVISVAQKMASDAEKQGRGSLRLAVGGERRFGNGLALDAELGIVSIAENSKAPDVVMPSTAGQLSRYQLGGGTLMIGVTYYF